MEIRILSSHDQAILSNVGPDVFDHPIDPQAANEFLADPRHHIVVAIDAGQVVGFASAVHYFHPDKPRPELFINEVGVAIAYRRRGLAKSLLQALFQHARQLGCTEAWVLTDRTNLPAMRLYASAGGAEPPHDQVMFSFRL
jgi:ribosomal protein S18 acetylase RimI-like enzyme